MANKGNNRHIKSLNAPKFFGVAKKGHKYTAKQSPGRHSFEKSAPLQTIVKKTLLFSGTAEAVKSIKNMQIAVNGSKVKDPKYPVGLNDIISIEPIGKKFLVSINLHGQAVLKEHAGQIERNAKVTGKYLYRGNKLMIKLHDGSVIPSPSKDVKVGDTIVLSESKDAKQHFPLKAGASCMVIDGVHVGAMGKIVNMAKGNMHTGATATVEQDNGERFNTLAKNLIVTG